MEMEMEIVERGTGPHRPSPVEDDWMNVQFRGYRDLGNGTVEVFYTSPLYRVEGASEHIRRPFCGDTADVDRHVELIRSTLEGLWPTIDDGGTLNDVAEALGARRVR